MSNIKIRAMVDESTKAQAWSEWRITNPFNYLKSYSIDAETMWCEIGDDIDCDILVLPRLVVGTKDQQVVSEWFLKLKSKGIKIVYECDDDIFSPFYVQQMVAVNYKEEFGQDILVRVVDEFDQRARDSRWVLDQCDAVTCSTKSLGIYLQSITNIPIFVIPNALDVRKFSK